MFMRKSHSKLALKTDERTPGLRGLLRRIRADVSGLALIEFAYTLPIFVSFGIVGMEFTNVVLAYQKSERVASVLADQVASNQIAPNERQMGDMFDAVALIAKPFEFNPQGNVILTAVIGIYDEDDDEVQNKIAWQRCSTKDSFESNIGTEWTATNDIADGEEVTLPNNVELGQNQMVIVSEVYFPYSEMISEKLVASVLPGDGNFYERAMFRTRGAALLNITPVTGVATHEC